MRSSGSTLAGLALLAPGALAGCGSSDLVPATRRDAGRSAGAGSLADEVASRLHSESRLEISCPGGAPETAGESRDCVVHSGADAVSVRVTRLRGGGLDVVPVLSADVLAEEVAGVLVAEHRGRRVGEVRCDGEMLGERGAHAACTAVLDGEPVRLRIRCAQVRGLMVDFEVWEERGSR